MNGHRLTWYIPLFVIPLLFAVSQPLSDAMDLTLDTSIPEYILDDNITINGTYADTQFNKTDSVNGHFSLGTLSNVTVDSDSVLLKPELDIKIMNNGNAVLTNGGSSAWDRTLRGKYVLKVNSTYYLFYIGGPSWQSAHIGLATSSDGISWTKHPSNPVMRSNRYTGDPERSYAAPVVYHDGAKFYMYYSAWDGSGWHISLATSSDGTNWTRHGSNPIISNGPNANSWNWVIQSCSIYKDGNTFRLYYFGFASGGDAYLGLATSTDLVSWSNNPGNPLRKGDTSSWEGDRTTYGTLEKNGTSYRLWSTSGVTSTGKWKLGWLTSTDAVNFVDSGSAILNPKANTIYANGVRDPIVFDLGDHYLMITVCYDSNGVISYGAFNVTMARMDGIYTSVAYDARGVVGVTDITWVTNVSLGGQVDLFLRWANQTPNWSTWYQVEHGTLPIGTTGRYFQYKAEFTVPRDWMRPRLNLFRVDYLSPVKTLQVRVTTGGQWVDIPFSGNVWNATVDLTDGDYWIEVRAENTMGLTMNIPRWAKVDLYPPTGNITLEYGRWATNSTWIRYDLLANDTHGPYHYMLSTTPDLAGADWYNMSTGGLYSLGQSPEGPITFYVKYRDAAGRVSETYNDTVVVDTTPPEATMLIDGGAKYTNSTHVTLDVNWTDVTGIVAMMVSTDPDFEGSLWEDPMFPISGLLEGTDGAQAIYVRLQDAVGWVTTVSDGIILDRTPPTASIVIDDDAPYATSRDVLLSITVHDDSPSRIKLASDGEPWPDSWRNITSPTVLPWRLPPARDGARTVRLLVEDAAGNAVVVSDDILLDTTAPEAELILAGGNQFISELLVSVHLAVTDATSGVSKMRMTDTGYFTDTPWLEFNEDSTWLFPEGEGVKTLFVQVMDGAGLVTSLDASVVMDTTAPSGTFTINGGDTHVQTPEVTLDLDFEDDFVLDGLRASDSPGFEGVEWVPYVTSMIWVLVDEGERTVHLEVRDEAGNVVSADASIVYDGTPPVIEFVSPTKTSTTEERVEVEVSVADAIDPAPVIQWRLDGGNWETLSGTTFSVNLSEGEHSVEVRATDGAGNDAVLELKLEMEPEPSIASGPLLWVVIVVVVVIGAVGLWLWRSKASG